MILGVPPISLLRLGASLDDPFIIKSYGASTLEES